MLETIKKLIALLDYKERWQLAALTAVVLFTGLLQVAGVGSILPFLSLLSNPNLVSENKLLAWAFGTFGFSSTQTFLFSLGLLSLVVFLISNAFAGLTIWLMTRFAWANQARLATTLLDRYLHQPYSMFLDRNSADLGKNILFETQQFASGVLVPLLRIATFGATTLFITGFLVWFDPTLAFLAMGILGGGYALFFWKFRMGLLAKGAARMQATTLRFKVVDEALDSIKETKVLGRESAFVTQFSEPAKEFAHALAVQQVLRDLPRYFMDSAAFGTLLAVLLYLIGTGTNIQDIVPIIGVYAFAGYRLQPALNNIYRALSQIRFYGVVVETLYGEIHMQDLPAEAAISDNRANGLRRNVLNGSGANGQGFQQPAGKELAQVLGSARRQHVLELRDVTFTYANAGEPALQEISLAIPQGAFVGIVGETGAGKTTLIDIILGLLTPQEGSLMVNGVALAAGNLRAWQDRLGYVPQDVYLTDDTVAANIALGIAPVDRDTEAVEKAARIANIHEFVAQELAQGYETLVGERGIRLSGGQRQRIGIARALYHDPDLIVLDEATSNLDQGTEAAVHLAIEQAAAAKTVLMIAHRLSTTRSCDILYFLQHGRLMAQGTYEDLQVTSAGFRAMSGVP